MAYNDCSILAQKEQCQRFSDDVAPADDDRLFAGDLDSRTLQDLDDSRGRARERRWIPEREPAHVFGMKAVNILRRVYRFKYSRLRDLGRQRQLNQYSVNVLAAIKLTYQRKHLVLRYLGGQMMVLRCYP